MIRRFLLLVAAPIVAILAIGPVVDRLASRLMAAPRRLPEESGMAPALDRLGGEVVRLRSRDGLRLAGRWIPASPAAPEEDAGTGWSPDPREAILLLHGYSGSVTPDLVELGPFLRRTAAILGLDLRGHGGSDDAPTTFGLREIEDVAGAFAWLGERGVRRVALVGSSMGGVTAIAAVAVLGDGRLAAADVDPDAPAAEVDAAASPGGRRGGGVRHAGARPRRREPAAACRSGGGSRVTRSGAWRRTVGGDPRDVQPIAVVGLLEDVPLLLVMGTADRTLPIDDARRLADAAPAGTRRLEIEGADHSGGHATDPAGYESAVSGFLRDAFLAVRPAEAPAEAGAGAGAGERA